MSFRALRRALQMQPRLMLAVLLAFAVETLPPPSALVSHRHSGGDVAHTHVGTLGRTELATRSVGDGLTRAPARDLHQHVVHPVLAVRGPMVTAPPPSLLATALYVPAALDARTAALLPGQARAPPSLDA